MAYILVSKHNANKLGSILHKKWWIYSKVHGISGEKTSMIYTQWGMQIFQTNKKINVTLVTSLQCFSRRPPNPHNCFSTNTFLELQIFFYNILVGGQEDNTNFSRSTITSLSFSNNV